MDVLTFLAHSNFPKITMSLSPEDSVVLTTNGKIAIITLNIEKKLNALTSDLYYRLSCLMREIAARDDIFITVLTGKVRISGL